MSAGEPACEESLCVRCARLGHTCCQNTQIFVTLGDVRRIETVARGEAFTESVRSPGDVARVAKFDEVWSRTFRPGRRRVLAHRPNDDGCYFLTSAGCRLPLEVRPLICRLYPFDYNETAIKGVDGLRCPRPEAENGPLLLGLLGMNREPAEEWRKMLYREIREEFPDE